MKEIKKETIVYQAFDGKEFINKNDCEKYEAENDNINLCHFDFDVPYGDDGMYSWTAYKVNSENEFNMLMKYLNCNYDYLYGIDRYAGACWYAVQYKEDGGWADVRILSKIVRDFTNKLAEISDKTMNSLEV